MSAFKNSLVTFFSFSLFGLMPLIPVIAGKTHGADLDTNYIIAVIVIAVFFLFVLGFSKSFVTGIKWYWSVLETEIIGVVSAGIAYGMSRALDENSEN
jgi:VIT1/CCC1 family predicted Fe2+/Mn2+ transporter